VSRPVGSIGRVGVCGSWCGFGSGIVRWWCGVADAAYVEVSEAVLTALDDWSGHVQVRIVRVWVSASAAAPDGLDGRWKWELEVRKTVEGEVADALSVVLAATVQGVATGGDVSRALGELYGQRVADELECRRGLARAGAVSAGDGEK
jgi:hypothetical protein